MSKGKPHTSMTETDLYALALEIGRADKIRNGTTNRLSQEQDKHDLKIGMEILSQIMDKEFSNKWVAKLDRQSGLGERGKFRD